MIIITEIKARKMLKPYYTITEIKREKLNILSNNPRRQV